MKTLTMGLAITGLLGFSSITLANCNNAKGTYMAEDLTLGPDSDVPSLTRVRGAILHLNDGGQLMMQPFGANDIQAVGTETNPYMGKWKCERGIIKGVLFSGFAYGPALGGEQLHKESRVIDEVTRYAIKIDKDLNLSVNIHVFTKEEYNENPGDILDPALGYDLGTRPDKKLIKVSADDAAAIADAQLP